MRLINYVRIFLRPRIPKSEDKEIARKSQKAKPFLSKHNIFLTAEQRIQQRDDPPEIDEFNSVKFANVDIEVERLQQQHFIIKYIFGCNFSCPIENTLKRGARVLDGGCGPGAWLLEMATYYQNSQFFGIDIEPHYPSQIKPPNANFFQCDLMQLELLEFEENSFDMVRICLMFLLINQDYAKVIEKMLRLLKPGGYFEIIESDVSLATCGPNFLRILKTLEKGLSCEGLIGNVQTIIEKLFNANGQLKNVQRLTKVTKLGPLGGLAGELYSATLDDFFNGTVVNVMGKEMGMTSEEYDQFWRQCKAEFTEFRTEIAFEKLWGKKI